MSENLTYSLHPKTRPPCKIRETNLTNLASLSDLRNIESSTSQPVSRLDQQFLLQELEEFINSNMSDIEDTLPSTGEDVPINADENLSETQSQKNKGEDHSQSQQNQHRSNSEINTLKDILIHFINDVLDLEGSAMIKEVTFLSTIQDPEISCKKESIVGAYSSTRTTIRYMTRIGTWSKIMPSRRIIYRNLKLNLKLSNRNSKLN